MDRAANQRTGAKRSPDLHGRQRKLTAAVILALLACGLGLTALPRGARSAGSPVFTPPGGPGSPDQQRVAAITKTLALGPHAGDCDRCHTMHAGESAPQPYALVGPDENTLCDQCHTVAWQGGSYGGPLPYLASAHGSSPSAVWPGPVPPPRLEAGAAGKCLNCHDPHGRTDSAGLIPSLLYVREENECFACHAGSPASGNVRLQAQKPFRHPTTDYQDRHTGALESQPSDFGTTPLNRRHAECEDCHNSHVARTDPLLPDHTRPSNTLLGVSRVVPLNGSAGSPPAYTFVAGSDTLSNSPAEYQVCFKCHSSWTSQPSGQTDLARVLNPANPSYHPVEDVGRDATLSPLSFATGWSAQSRTACGDCHGDDVDPSAGPHGSNYRYLLKQPYAASSIYPSAGGNDLCFTCHSSDVYANPSASDLVRAASRFSAPASGTAGHAEHVGTHGVPCYACHVTHGSTTLPHLLATGRTPGMTSYSETPTGGSCNSTCHVGTQTYTTAYAR